MLSLAELRRAARAVALRVGGHRLERVVQSEPEAIALSFYGRDAETGEGVKRHLLLSCHPEQGRVAELPRPPRAPDSPPAFAAFLRAHLPRARLAGAELRGRDRQLVLHFDAHEGRFECLLALMGRRSNLYVLDAEERVRAALRPLEKTRRTLSLGARWEDPPADGLREGTDRFAEVSDRDYLSAVQEAYAERESAAEGEATLRRLEQVLRKERKAAARRLERIEAELAEADQAARLQRQGELLKTVVARVPPGAEVAHARDWETGEDVEIPLDPALSPKQNLDSLFKRYQKLLRRLSKAGGQLDEARARCAELEALEAELDDLRGGDGAEAAIEAFAARPAVRRLLAKHAPPRQAAPAARAPRPAKGPLRDLPPRLVPRRYRSRDGLEIWVGRSDEGNDHLTTRLARGNDLFFHLDGAPGSHVILRTEGRTDPPSESLLDACELAVHFSKQRNASRADVHVVPIKQVKKPKGAKRGLVYVTGGKTIHLRREEKRLERLLAARVDDESAPASTP